MDETIKLSLKNISCVSCVNTIESALTQVNGVKTAHVNFAEKTALITGSATLETLISAIEAVGYQAKPFAQGNIL